MDQPPPPTPIDGIAHPKPQAASTANQAIAGSQASASVSVPAKTTTPSIVSVSMIVLGIIIVLYTIPALALISAFPRSDASLSEVRDIGMAIYGLGALLWIGFGLIGFLRISSFKDRPKMQLMALVRLLLIVLPMIGISAATVVLVNRQPSLKLDVESPQSSDQLIAPVAVTFSTKTAAKVFAKEGLRPIKYEWDFNGDGQVDEETFEPHATYVFQSAKIFTVSARITMQNGMVKIASLRFNMPLASFGVEPAPPIVDEPVLFSLTNLVTKKEDLASAQWDFNGDGNIDVESKTLTTSFTYHRLGKVSPAVTINYTNNTQRKLSRSIEVVKPLVQPFPVEMHTEPSTLLGPAPLAAIFLISTDEPVANVSWTFGDQKMGEGIRVSNVYEQVGTYTVTALVHSRSGAIAKLQKVVRVTEKLDLPDLSFDGTPSVDGGGQISGEIPLNINITPSTSKPLVTFTWDASNASEVLSTDKTLQAVYRKEGKYTLDLIAMDSEQRVMRKKITVIVQPAKANVIFSMDPQAPTVPALVKFDSSNTFLPKDEEITGFEWDYGDSATERAGARTEHAYGKAGTYTITLNIRTTRGNVYTGRQTLVVRGPIIDACFDPSRRSGKAPLGVRFDTSCSVGEFTSWLWDFGDNAQSDVQNPIHSFDVPGDYTVILTATTKDGRKFSKRTTISVSP